MALGFTFYSIMMMLTSLIKNSDIEEGKGLCNAIVAVGIYWGKCSVHPCIEGQCSQSFPFKAQHSVHHHGGGRYHGISLLWAKDQQLASSSVCHGSYFVNLVASSEVTPTLAAADRPGESWENAPDSKCPPGPTRSREICLQSLTRVKMNPGQTPQPDQLRHHHPAPRLSQEDRSGFRCL